ncbi:MAG TPA: 2-dehydropantoate 2-reductase [Xanthobacteraceae bacterium]|nr:2-dehydropantoate 2-reductase [Xanthobacteraceae bacterium]
MKICIFGAGAIGSHLALRLVQAKADVSVVARGAQLEAIRSRGLHGRLPEGAQLHAHVRASEDPAALGPQDAVLVTVKAPALPSVARTIAPLLGEETPVAFVMNGIPWWYFYAHGGPLDGRRLPRLDPGDGLWNAVGPERVIGGVINAPSTVIAPGVVAIERAANLLTLGEPSGALSERAGRIAAAFRAGGLDAEVTGDIRSAVWNKLIANLALGPMAILAQASYRDLFAEPACVAAAQAIMHEAAAVATALGCKPDGAHEARLASVRNLAHKPSILQDLERGRPMEVDAILTTTIELARLVGVATPTLDLLIALVRLRAREAGLY